MRKKSLQTIFLSLFTVIIVSCSENNTKQAEENTNPQQGTFAYDKNFLAKHDTNLIELKSNNASVLVSAAYQAKVFTSSADGEGGKSFGWINYKAFRPETDPHMNAYGGENRLWLGPEGGKYSLYFKKGDSMVFANWKTPAPIDTEAWQVDKKDDKSVTLKKEMSLTNFVGTTLKMAITRTVTVQDKNQIEQALYAAIGDSLKFVGYSTQNVVKNTGDAAWTEKTGMPCIWILDMFNPSDSTTIVVPHKSAEGDKKVATTNYFGEISSDRIKITDNVLFFKADGKSRGKLGIVPAYAVPYAGSYDAQNNVLTLTFFTVDNNERYLNQEWNVSKPVFSGDAMNAYNDGPLPGGSQMGPFYELESVSPAAALKPNEEVSHTHNVYHFTGDKEQLNALAEKVLRVSLDEIRAAFK
ncbi:MAG: hypothetical protein JNK79_05330 [Chitinophagaceae bacterium]|nr:hypothetical protein [Chitinophagaceae bacterium]